MICDRAAYFLALDLLGNCGTLARALLYMVMYTSFAQPRAVLWQMYVVTAAVIYACTGTAYFLSQASFVPPALDLQPRRSCQACFAADAGSF